MNLLSFILVCICILSLSTSILLFLTNRNGKKRAYFLLVFLLAFLFIAISLYYLVINPKRLNEEVPNLDQTSSTLSLFVSPTPSPMISPSISELPAFPEEGESFHWLDDLTPIIAYEDDFFSGSWGDQTAFHIDERPYKHGIGMQLVEGSKCTVDETPNGTSCVDCRKATIQYPLRQKYSSFSFSLGCDNGNLKYFGDQYSNGIARLLMYDEKNRKIFFDTGWSDYSYLNYDLSLDISDVDILSITYFTSGVAENWLKNGLRFAIVDPILILKDDAE